MKAPIILLPCLLLLATGCQPSGSSDASNDSPDVSGQSEPVEELVSIASWDEIQQKIADQQGKIVVVDLWSTWCLPCIREFPNLVKLQKDHPESVTCMSVNLNYDGTADAPPESYLDEVRKFVTEKNATFNNFVCSDPADDVYTRIDLASIPAIYVYDKTGKMRKRFDNDLAEYGDEGFTYEQHVIPLIEELLAE